MQPVFGGCVGNVYNLREKMLGSVYNTKKTNEIFVFCLVGIINV